MDSVSKKRAAEIARDESLGWGDVDGGTLFLTGSTGLIGKAVVQCVLARNEITASPISLVLPVRDTEKATTLFPEAKSPFVLFIPYESDWASIGVNPDYVLHLAAMTSSADFLNKPLEVLSFGIESSFKVLNCCEKWRPKKALLSSSMEVYGSGAGHPLKEGDVASFDPAIPRNSYPLAKNVQEALFLNAYTEKEIPSVVARLAQSFGPGVKEDDGRVFADFARRAKSGEDIVLLTSGEKRNMYVHVYDAASAFLFLLAKGDLGAVYNVANEQTCCSIREMAELVITQCSPRCDARVRVAIDPLAVSRFRPDGCLNLDCGKLRNLGWSPKYSIETMYSDLLESWL